MSLHRKLNRSARLVQGRILLLLLTFTLLSYHVKAEGTAQLVPQASGGQYGNIQISYGGWASYPQNIKSDNKLQFTVSSDQETIFLGFNLTAVSNGTFTVTTMVQSSKIHIVDQNGINVITYACPLGASPGYISSLSEAYLGPNTITPGGYTPLILKSLQPGDYSVEFERGQNGVGLFIRFFDITISSFDGSNYKAIPGRVWAKNWPVNAQTSLQTGAMYWDSFYESYAPFYGFFYVYTDDGIVTSLNTNGMRIGGCNVFCNSWGTDNDMAVSWNTRRKSVSRQPSTIKPQYKIFLGPPDPTAFPTGLPGTIYDFRQFEAKCDGSVIFYVKANKPGIVNLTIDCPPIGVSGPEDRTDVADSVQAGDNYIEWDGRDGRGNWVFSGTNVGVNALYLNGLTNFPVFDIESNEGGLKVNYIRPIPEACDSIQTIYWDDTDLPSGGSSLSGCKHTDVLGCHTWPYVHGSSGNNNNVVVGNQSTVNTWWYYETRYSKTIPVTIKLLAVDLGKDTVICADESYNLSGARFSNCDTIRWSTTGTGKFDNDTTKHPVYTPSALDIALGSIKIMVKAWSDTTCPPVRDTLLLKIVPLPTVSKTAQRSVCENASLTISGIMVNDYSRVEWINYGSGSLASITTLTPTYTAAKADAGKDVKLVIVAYGKSPCGMVKDSLYIHVDPLPAGNAGTVGEHMCQEGLFQVKDGDASASNYSTIIWSVPTNYGSIAAPGTLTPTYSYNPTAGYFSTVTLTMLVNGTGACLNEQATSAKTITIDPQPIADAGSDTYLCQDGVINYTLHGGGNHYSSIRWYVPTGTGSFISDNTLDAVYKIGYGDRGLGNTIPFILTLQGTGQCADKYATSTMTLSIDPEPIANAGPPVESCGYDPVKIVQDVEKYYTQLSWTSNGGGNISNPQAEHPEYLPVAADQGKLITLMVNVTGCRTSQTATSGTSARVHIPPTGILTGSTDICIGKNTPLRVDLTGGGTWTVTWEESGTNTQATTTASPFIFSVTPLKNTMYTLLKVEDAWCPSAVGTATGTAKVDVYKYPDIYELNSDRNGAYCADEAGSMIILGGSETGMNYQLKLNGATLSPTVSGTGSPLNFGPLATRGDYQAIATNPGAACISSMTGQVTVIRNPLPVTDFTINLACTNKNTLFKANGNFLAGLIGTWSFGDGGTASYTGTTTSHTYLTSTTASVTLSVTDVNGCSFTSKHSIPVYKSPESIFGIMNADSLDIGYILLDNKSIGADQYHWDFGNGTSSKLKDPPPVYYNEDGTYTIQLIVTSPDKCIDTSMAEQKIMTTNIFIPNAFSPEDFDPNVKVFKPSAWNLAKYRVEIYDRWGNLVWYSEKLNEKGEPAEGWDGTKNGEPLPSGVYLWKIFGVFGNGEIYGNHLKDNFPRRIQGNQGSVTLIR